jgi:hypothetical protein
MKRTYIKDEKQKNSQNKLKVTSGKNEENEQLFV